MYKHIIKLIVVDLLQNVGACNVDQVQGDVHKLAWNILLNSKQRGRDAKKWSKYLQESGFWTQKLKKTTKNYDFETMQHNQGSQTGYGLWVQTQEHTHIHMCACTHSPSLSFGSTVLEVRATSNRADK